jgi:glycosyltransferase involved in cell wall biosynthesis
MVKCGLLTIIVPCYNEDAVLPETVKELGTILENLIKKGKIDPASKLLFVNDGSQDRTWQLITDFEKDFDFVTGIKFSRNFGHQNALLAGMTTAVEHSDMVITIDADLQDDVTAIYEMVAKYNQGFDVVYGVRSSRQTDTFFKRRSALAFYSLMKHMGVDMVPNSADYRLMSKRAVTALLKFKERNLFLRGMVPLVGYPSAKVLYERKERFAGESKYPLNKMIRFAFDGISSFSTVPIRMIMSLGFLVILISVFLLIFTLVQWMRGAVISGWSSLMISIWFLGGVQLVCVSVIGEYVGKIFKETKQRPRFTIEKDDFTPKFKK